jgi:photosystem II stability/assembly factor-like uncharacterized protein
MFLFQFRAYAQWQQLNLPLANAEDLYGITFINSSSFYICSNTQISKTTDNGANWSVSTLNNAPYLANTLKDLHFYSATEGIVTGVFNLTNEEFVLSTNDGGANWSSVYYGPTNEQHFFNALDTYGSNVLACGTKGHIIKSTSNGSGFTDVSTSSAIQLRDIKFINSDWAIAVGDGILRTVNGGISWTKDPNLSSSYSSISVGTPGSGLVYISDYYSLLKSTDSGTTFTRIITPLNEINSVTAVNTTTVFVGTDHGIYVSLDGGASWNKFSNTKDKAVQKIEIYNGKAYALCRNKILLVLDIATMKPEPVAAFTPAFDAICGKTTLNSGNHSPANCTYQWYVDNVLVSSQYNFTATYTSSGTITIKLIVNNANGADTVITPVGVPYKTPVQADLGPDVYQCYGASMYVSTKYLASNYEWLPQDAVFWTSKPEVLTRPLYKDTKIYLKVDNGECQAYDTLMIYVGGAPLQEQFFPQQADGSEFVCDLEFLSDKVGYGFSHRGRLLKTTDGGSNWQTIPMNGSDNLFYATIDFIDENTGYVPRGDYKAQKTTDGGKTFTDLNVTAELVSFINKDTGVFVNRVFNAASGVTRIYKTTDGGNTFTLIYDPDQQERFYPFNIKMLNANVIVMGGGYNANAPPPKMKRSLDGGATWENIPIPADAFPYYMDVVSADTLFFNSYKYIYRTYDAGKNWFKYLIYPGEGQGGQGTVEMYDSQTGYATLAGSVFKTSNGGDCWTKVFADSTNIISNAIAFSPSGKSLFFSANKSYFTATSQIYHRQLQRDLKAWIDSAYCEGTTIKTHNGCFGYTHNQWFLNDVLYSTAYDTALSLKEGDYTLKLKVDSLGFHKDSLLFKFHIKATPDSLGRITGQTPICSDYVLGNNTNHAEYSVVPNAAYTKYIWSVDQPLYITSTLQQNVTKQELYFAKSNTIITLKILAKTKDGCISPDTAVFKIRTRNQLPGNATAFDMQSPPCIRLDSSSFDKNQMPLDSVYCKGLPDADADYYIIGAYVFNKPEANIPVWGNCSEQVYSITYANANVCGASTTIERRYQVYYEPYAITHTLDTIVKAYDPADLRVDIYPDKSSFGNCNNIYTNWYFKGTSYPKGNVLHFDRVTPADTGIYTARLVNGCDTTYIPIKLSITTVTNMNSESAEPLLIKPNPFVETLYIQGPFMEVLQVVNLLGGVEKTISPQSTYAELNLRGLAAGIYFVVCFDKNGKLTGKQKVVKQL